MSVSSTNELGSPSGVVNLFSLAFAFPVAVVAAVAVYLNWGR